MLPQYDPSFNATGVVLKYILRLSYSSDYNFAVLTGASHAAYFM